MNRRAIIAGASAFALNAQASVPAERSIQLYDSHVHFYTHDVADYPLDVSGAYQGEDVLRRLIMEHPQTPEKTLALWAANGVAGGVGVQYNAAYKTDNRYLLDVHKAWPDKIAAVVILDARAAETPQKLARLVREQAVSGVRITGFPDKDGGFPWMDSPEAGRTWAMADELGCVIEMMYLLPGYNPAALAAFARLAEKYTRVQVVIDHMGWPATGGAPDYGLTPAHTALALPNLSFKFTTITLDALDKAGLDAAAFLRHAVDVFGAGHVMWGSDYGNTLGDYADLVKRAVAATSSLTPGERRQVLHDTGKRIFGELS